MTGKKAAKRVKLELNVMGDETSIVIPTTRRHYGSDADAEGVRFMRELGERLDRLGVPHEKMYRDRVNGSLERIVDRIRIPTPFLDLISGTARART